MMVLSYPILNSNQDKMCKTKFWDMFWMVYLKRNFKENDFHLIIEQGRLVPVNSVKSQPNLTPSVFLET